MSRDYDAIVVGAGASGMMAAISAARTGARVAILEHMDEAGKKLLMTGNGKCNFTNQVQNASCYRGQDPAFALPVLGQFDVGRTLGFFKELGIWPKALRGGYYYPASGQASSVRQALLSELRRLHVDCHYGIGIRHIRKENGSGRFVFDTKSGIFQSKICILATGGKAAKRTGSDGSGIPYVVGFGHRVADFVPALVQMQGKQSFLQELAGIRADARLSLFAENSADGSLPENAEKLAEDRGEVQLTEFGLSGIPSFQVSRFASYALREGKRVYALLDFAPDMASRELLEFFLLQQRCRDCTAEEALLGLFPSKLGQVLLREAGIVGERPFAELSRLELEGLSSQAKQFRIDVIGDKGFDAAQACAGGVLTCEIDNATMESKLVRGLYFAGELVDIDGICGGYNLQWAWSSGWVAGLHGGNSL